MKSSELRSGNYLQGPEFTHPRMGMWSDGKVAVSAFGIAHIESNPFHGLNPIPLTPSILEACGFKREGKGGPISYDLDISDNASLAIYFDKGVAWANIEVWGEVNDLSHDFTTPVKSDVQYLHQLQNVVFSLTGQELTVNLPQSV